MTARRRCVGLLTAVVTLVSAATCVCAAPTPPHVESRTARAAHACCDHKAVETSTPGSPLGQERKPCRHCDGAGLYNLPKTVKAVDGPCSAAGVPAVAALAPVPAFCVALPCPPVRYASGLPPRPTLLSLHCALLT